MLKPNTPPLPHRFYALPNQVAGHFHGRGKTKLGMIKRSGGAEIMKAVQHPPRGHREKCFYLTIGEMMNEKKKLGEMWKFIERFASIIPQFFGTFSFRGIEYLKLEDINFGMGEAAIIDLKIGRRTYDIEASPLKILHDVVKYPVGNCLSFRVAGMRTFDKNNWRRLILLEKLFLRRLTCSNFNMVFFNYFKGIECSNDELGMIDENVFFNKNSFPSTREEMINERLPKWLLNKVEDCKEFSCDNQKMTLKLKISIYSLWLQYRLELIERIEESIRDNLLKLFEDQYLFKFFSTSILISYDVNESIRQFETIIHQSIGKIRSLLEKKRRKKKINFFQFSNGVQKRQDHHSSEIIKKKFKFNFKWKLIDFTHVYYGNNEVIESMESIPELSPDFRDSNMIEGIQSLLDHFSQLRLSIKREIDLLDNICC
ncbi:hypothetical protein SNEBB_006780 [Seison nebaliae]|nr:hypothetical protein SNEBB_006780 [Seison nebaliae]